MKITSVTAEQIELKEGGKGGIIIGIGLIVMGLFFLLCFSLTFNAATGGIMFAIMAIVGIVVILFTSTITVIANRRTGQLIYEKKRLAGAQKSVYSFQEVYGIETRHEWHTTDTTDSDGYRNQETTLTATSRIFLKDGRKLEIGSQRNNSRRALAGVPGSVSTLSATLAQFLNVPYQEVAPQ